MSDDQQTNTMAMSFSPKALGFAMALGTAAEAVLAKQELTGAEVTEGIALFAAAVAGRNAQDGKADAVLSLMQLSMAMAADQLRAAGLWYGPASKPS